MIIDFRLRPPFEGLVGSQMYEPQTIAWINRVMGTGSPDGPLSAISGSMPLALAEMHSAGITVGVVQGRHRPGTYIPNDALKRLVDTHPGRFVALASVNVLDASEAAHQIETAVSGYGFPGISLDLAALGLAVDDRKAYAVYEMCAATGAFVAITLSMLGAKDFSLINPAALDRAARDFPGVQFVSAHGSYPFVLEAIAVAMKRENVWLSPDMYMTHAPGSNLYVQAAAGYLQDRMLFGTSYPYTPMSETVTRFQKLDISEEARQKLLHSNARRLLKLDIAVAS